MGASPWGWNLPITSPTMRAVFLNADAGPTPSSCIPKSMRRCTGLRPSRTSGSARETMTDIA